MKQEDSDSHKRIAELEAQVSALKEALKHANQGRQTAEQDVKRLTAFAKSLSENLDINKIMLWAKSSEKLTDADLKKLRKDLALTVMNPDRAQDLDIAEASRPDELDREDPIPVITTRKAKTKKRRGRQPGVKTCGRDMSCFDVLERREVLHDLKSQPDDPAYDDCLEFVKQDTRQQLEYVRGYFRNKVTVTYIYKDSSGKLVCYRNKVSPDFVKGGKLTNGAAAAVITDKIIWSLPLYRQAQRINMINDGNLVSAQLLNSYYLSAAHVITPVWEDLLEYIKSQRAIHGDETRLLVINNTEKGRCALGQVWAMSYQGKHPPAAFFKFYPSRKASCADELYKDCRGLALQTDGYGVYASLARDINTAYAEAIRIEEGKQAAQEFLTDAQRLMDEGILLVGCLAHARRKVMTCYEAVYKKKPESEGYRSCNTILGLVGNLYEIESRLRPAYESDELSEDEFLSLRREQAAPIIRRLAQYAAERIQLHEHEHALKKALNYMIRQIGLIGNYLESSELTPDNNFQERQIRGLAVGRKNSLFASSVEGALAWSKLLTVLRTAILNECDPTLYLKYLLDHITAIMDADVKAKDVDWSQFRPWNIPAKKLQDAWGT